MASHLPFVDRVPSLQEVEQLRNEAKTAYKQDQLRKACRNRLTEAAYETSHRCLEAKIDALARGSCRQLTNKVMTHLPREVRDSIYAYILERAGYSGSGDVDVWKLDLTIDVAPRDITDPLFPPTMCKRVLYKWQHLHCWDKKWCGTDFVQELVETFYQVTKFKFFQSTLYCLPLFLGLSGPINFTESPADIVLPFEHVKKLRFYLDYGKHPMKSTLSALQSLRKLKRKATIELIMLIEEVLPGERYTRRAAEVIEDLRPAFPLFDDLHHDDHQINVRFGMRWEMSEAELSNDWDNFSVFKELEKTFHDMTGWVLCDDETAYRAYGIVVKTAPSSKC